ncbi:MAG: TetR/AcrR family transcriptional regulator [Gammaproteobacteria bacterium]|nr:TetR/AcrR family transcriptional regulator [Gammaproteobacteria bacterium]MDH5593452.1 TetR/AcrR family transcriptional regulator [Gammaproteobacteria bacterium]
MSTNPDILDNPRARILEAAEVRFRQYGYNKTTMNEIANDCQMSAANLYRYFESKLDIGAAMAQGCFIDKEQLLEEVVNRTDLSATKRLEEFVLTLLRYTHGQCYDQPRINELVDSIIQERPALVQRKIAGERALLEQILTAGKSTGEFDIKNIGTTTEAVHTSLVKFSVPLFMGMYPLDEFERIAKNVVALLVNGLKK